MLVYRSPVYSTFSYSTLKLAKTSYNQTIQRASLAVQRLRLCVPSAGDLGSIPDQGNRSHVLQLNTFMPLLRCTTAKYTNQLKKNYWTFLGPVSWKVLTAVQLL